MAEYRTEVPLARRYLDWGAIWGGIFCFMAIWVVFESLGVAIFSSAAAPGTSGLSSVGFALWTIVLSIVAMAVAGRQTGRFSGAVTRQDGLIHGLVMYGLSVVAVIVLFAMGGSALATGVSAAGTVGAAGAAAPPVAGGGMLGHLAGLGWGSFVALFLGWLAALGGAASGAQRRPEREVREFRPAA